MTRNFWGNTKPPAGTALDLSHPLALGLVGLWTFSEGAGAPQPSYLRGRSGSPAVSLSSVIWVPDDNGPTVTQTGVGAGSPSINTGTLTSAFLPSQGTVVWRAWLGFAANDGRQHYFWGTSAGPSPEFSCQKFSDNNWYIGWTTGSDKRLTVAAGATNFQQSAWQTWAYVWDSAGSRLFWRGRQVATSVNVPTPAAIANPWSWMNATASGTTGLDFSSKLDYGAIYDRALTAQEVHDLAAQPYAMFAAPVWARRSAPAALARFRRSLSPVGARVGSRQVPA